MTASKTLDELFAAIKNGAVALDDTLPTFGPEWANPLGVWSWDETRMLVGTCLDDLEIVPQDEVNEKIEIADAHDPDLNSECFGHPAGPFDPMGETVYCDGSCISR